MSDIFWFLIKLHVYKRVRDESCHENFFLAIKDHLNELYTVNYWNQTVVLDVYQIPDKSFIKRVSRLIGVAWLYVNIPA
jgi:hypothetical protein